MKAGIVTLGDTSMNYGNRLQHYAVGAVLQDLGVRAESIEIRDGDSFGMLWLKYWMQRLSAYHLPGDSRYWKYQAPKKIQFCRFDKKYFHSRYIRKIGDIKKFDKFVLGSDQVWNPAWYSRNPLRKELYLLTFAKPEQKVCFAPSFGAGELPEEWKPWFKEHLSSFPRISVREESGKRIVRELTGKDAEVLIDPTLMLDAKEWLQIARSPRGVDCEKPYVLTYFLGERAIEADNLMKELGEAYGFHIYNLMDYKMPGLYRSGPREFIYLIAHAGLILTDSFHGSVFSFLFEKPFLVYERQGEYDNMFSRIETLLDKFDLRRKYANSKLKNELLESDYSVGKMHLRAEREKVRAFLRESMNAI